MNQRYLPGRPRLASTIAAIALAALNLGVLIVLPARLATTSEAGRTVVAPHVDSDRAYARAEHAPHRHLIARAVVDGVRAGAQQWAHVLQ